MPASRFTKKAKTPKQKRQWQHVYESELNLGRSKGRAVQIASGIIKQGGRRRKSRGRRRKR